MVLVDEHRFCEILSGFGIHAVNFWIVFDVVDPNVESFIVGPVGTKYPMVKN